MKSGGTRAGRRPSRSKARTREPWLQRPLGLAAMERISTPQSIARLIRGRILGGEVGPGRRLEPMRVLASDLGVSLPSVREAIAQLRGEGLVEVRHGVGTSPGGRGRHESSEHRCGGLPEVRRRRCA